MNDKADNKSSVNDSRGRKPRRRRPLVYAVIILFDVVVVLGIVLFLGALALSGLDLPTPHWVAREAGERLSNGLGGGHADVGSVTFRVENDQLPQVSFHDVAIQAPDGTDLVSIPTVGVSLDKGGLWQGAVRPRMLTVDGAGLTLRRTPDGRLDLGFGEGTTPSQLGSLEDAMTAVRRTFELPGLAPIERIEITGLGVLYEDERVDRTWRVENGTLILDNDSDSLSVSLTLLLPPDDAAKPQDPATIALRLSIGKNSPEAELSALIEGVPAADIAAQAPALSWLQLLDADVSGALIVGTTPDGGMGALNGTLEIGSGALQPDVAARPISFDGARAYFSYRPDTARITFEELSVVSPEGEISASGHALLEGMENGWPRAMVSQLQISKARLDPPDLLPRPAEFDGGTLDVKITLDPFVARIGQFNLVTTDPDGLPDWGTTRFNSSGLITADADGWHVSLDMALDQVQSAPLLALWPVRLVPKTRQWIARHLISGLVYNTHAGLRLDEGKRPDLGLTFEFQDAALRPIRTLPPITGAAGFASVGRDVFSLSLDEGQITPPEGGEIDMAGSVFRVGDTREKPSRAELRWRSDSSITAALSLLDQEPFRFLQKAGQPVDLAEGRAGLTGVIRFPMRRLRPGDVTYDIDGVLSDVVSDKAVPGRSLEAQTLRLQASQSELMISGDATLEGIPVNAGFSLPLGPDAAPASVEGTIRIGGDFIRQFSIGLPRGMLSGAGPADFRVDLPRGSAPTFALSSGLSGVGLSVPSLGWSKPPARNGNLRVSGRLGASPRIDSLFVEASGLTAKGALTLAADGGLGTALFSRLAVGGWLDAPVRLEGRGIGRMPSVFVEGGRIDVRKTSMSGTGGGGSAGPPMSLALDRLVISDGLELRKFRGDMVPARGLSGTFRGLVNGAAEVSGTVEPGRQGGTAIRIKSANAGAVFKAAKFFRQANGGSMSLVLEPRRETGQYDGRLSVENIRVKSAYGLAALINSISVVGLLDELNGAGIVFSDVDATFRLTPTYVQVTSSSAVGSSLGITMEGIYDLVSDRIDMQGVFSPVYMVNSIGAMFTRRGEGLFGFTYRMRGSASNPDVEVNPLSVLTPGMFREIFRAAPPQVRNGG